MFGTNSLILGKMYEQLFSYVYNQVKMIHLD